MRSAYVPTCRMWGNDQSRMTTTATCLALPCALPAFVVADRQPASCVNISKNTILSNIPFAYYIPSSPRISVTLLLQPTYCKVQNTVYLNTRYLVPRETYTSSKLVRIYVHRHQDVGTCEINTFGIHGTWQSLHTGRYLLQVYYFLRLSTPARLSRSVYSPPPISHSQP